MKKTMIALMALAGLALAAEPVTYTFTTSGGSADNRGASNGICFVMGNTDRMAADPELSSTTLHPLYIQSIALETSSTTANGTTPMCMFIIDSSYTLLAVSEACTPTGEKSEVLTFNFNETASLMTNPNPEVNTTNSSLSAGTQYYAFFLNADRYSSTTDRNYNASIGSTLPTVGDRPWADSNTLNIALRDYNGTDTARQNAVLSGASGKYDEMNWSGRFGAKMTITVKTPEPATATLSLLALAGLASRRRRH